MKTFSESFFEGLREKNMIERENVKFERETRDTGVGRDEKFFLFPLERALLISFQAGLAHFSFCLRGRISTR